MFRGVFQPPTMRRRRSNRSPTPLRRDGDARQAAPPSPTRAGGRTTAAGRPSLQRARRLGHRIPLAPPPTPRTGAVPVQRKIGAEIEVPQAHLVYDKETPASQGEKVGALVPGIETEIHLEAPANGVATFEFATGLHDQVPPKNPLSLAFQAGYLGTWMETGVLKKKQWLASRALVDLEPKWQKVNDDRGPLLEVGSGAKGAFQVNVSPTKEAAPSVMGAFDALHAFSFDRDDEELEAQEAPVNQALKDSKQYALDLYGAVVGELKKAAEKDTLPPRILAALKALTSVPRFTYFQYLRKMEGFTSSTHDIIDKNVLEVLPRANLAELWSEAVQDDESVDWNALIGDALEAAIGATELPRVRTTKRIDKMSMEVFQLQMELDELRELPIQERMEKLERITELSEKWDQLAEEHGTRDVELIEDVMALQEAAHQDMLAVLRGDKVLIRDRGKKDQVQPPSILGKHTDSSLLPVGEEQGEAGVYEIRNPFTHQIELADWGTVTALYEAELAKAGVEY